MWVLALMALCAVILVIERWFDIGKRTAVDAESFTNRIKQLLEENKREEAIQLCDAGGKRVLPKIFGAGIRKSAEQSELVRNVMEQETLHVIPILEKRSSYILMFANTATLVGLMGTIYGLILSFAAVARPDVAPVEKSSLLASGISTAMNTTLLGLIISVPCVLAYSILRSKSDRAIQEIDRYSVSLLRILLPVSGISKNYRLSARRIKEEIQSEADIKPMMNLMVILIPLLLSSSEFVKIGAIELKLPQSSSAASNASVPQQKKDALLDLGIYITDKGFNLYHYFKSKQHEEQDEDSGSTDTDSDNSVDIPKNNGAYDYEALNAELAKVKQKVLLEIIRSVNPGVASDAALVKLFNYYIKNDFDAIEMFKDHEAVKIIAEEQVKYQTVISVMDAARGTRSAAGIVTLFPDVSLGGGIVQ